MTGRVVTPEEHALASIHDFCVRVLVACGDGADHPDHPDWPVATAARKMAHNAVLIFVYGVDDLAAWELHEAVARAHPHLDPSCRYCRIRFAMYAEREKDEAMAKAERVQTLLAP